MKIGIIQICLNEIFWPYAQDMLVDARKRLFPGEDVEFMMWTDIPQKGSEREKESLAKCQPEATLKQLASKPLSDQEFSALVSIPTLEKTQAAIDYFDLNPITIFPIDATPWPYPTLLRYHLFLQQEEYLQKFDKLLYIDADMRVMQDIKTDIFGEWLTCAKHPMYALDRRFIPPYEPNPNSSAFIPRFGQILTDHKKLWFDPVYAAGGVQGGATKPFLEAMWWMKRSIDRDLQNNYIAIWNDESHWNAYLSSHPNDQLVVLGPDYVYPDSLVKEYYEPIWGRTHEPKIVTITKRHSLSREAGRELAKYSGKHVMEPLPPIVCPTCHDILQHPPGQQIGKLTKCNGAGKSHDCELLVIATPSNTCPTCGDYLPAPNITKVTSCGGVGGLHHIETAV